MVGGVWGCEVSIRIVKHSIQRLEPNGILFLYTGTPVVNGEDMFRAALQSGLRQRAISYQYEEVDLDVFGEELENPPYNGAERIATVILIVEVRTRESD
jgi:release factor glutamine methyltransferase